MLTSELSSYVLVILNNSYSTQSKSYWLLSTQSKVLQVDWLKFENKEKATMNITMPYPYKS